MGKHVTNDYPEGRGDLRRRALDEHARNGGYSAGNQDDSQRGRGNAEGQQGDRSQRD